MEPSVARNQMEVAIIRRAQSGACLYSQVSAPKQLSLLRLGVGICNEVSKHRWEPDLFKDLLVLLLGHVRVSGFLTHLLADLGRELLRWSSLVPCKFVGPASVAGTREHHSQGLCESARAAGKCVHRLSSRRSRHVAPPKPDWQCDFGNTNRFGAASTECRTRRGTAPSQRDPASPEVWSCPR